MRRNIVIAVSLAVVIAVALVLIKGIGDAYKDDESLKGYIEGRSGGTPE